MLPPHARDLEATVAVQAARIARLEAANAALEAQVAEPDEVVVHVPDREELDLRPLPCQIQRACAGLYVS